MDSDKSLREHLAKLLDGGQAHVTFEAAVKGIPVALRGKRPKGAGHSLWEILEHMRIAQWDILEFSRDANHVSPKWPKGYWPDDDQTGSPEAWDETVQRFQDDLESFEDLLRDPATDLFAKIPHGTGQTILRAALVLADHNSNHLGVLVAINRIINSL